MFPMKALSAFAICFATLVARAQAGDVYAHFIVGNAGAYTQADWAKDIAAAADSKIDGFALNIAPNVATSTDVQVGYAYAAAEAHGNFKLFFSFDYAANNGFSASEIETTINKYKTSSAQAMYQNKPLASTFEGPAAAGDWAGIKSNTGCFFVPDWSSAKGTPSTFSVADGALSWDIWPTGANDMTTANDKAWQSLLGSKAYMMGISPWFYTDLPQYSKNWLWRGNSLWYDRWQQAIELQPELIEIVTWNDFGESHYIGPVVTSEIPQGAQGYAANNPHDGWRALLPYYIDAYKNGNKTATPTEDILSWAHQPNPGKACSSGGTTGGQDGSAAVTAVAEDIIDVDVVLSAPADISVAIGGNQATKKTAVSAGISHFAIPFNDQTGQVIYTVSRNGATVMTVKGATISSDCGTLGHVNWNAVTGSQTASGSSNGTAPASTQSSAAPSLAAASSAVPATVSVVAQAATSAASAAPSSGSGSCGVNFAVKDVTQWGESVFVSGNHSLLGSWDTSKALALNANQYTAANPLWVGSAAIPAGVTVGYKYFTKEADGSVKWETGANRSLITPVDCGSPIVQNDDVSA